MKTRTLLPLILILFLAGCTITPDMSRGEILSQIHGDTKAFTPLVLSLSHVDERQALELKGDVAIAYSTILGLTEPTEDVLDDFAMLIIRGIDDPDDRTDALALWLIIKLFIGDNLRLELPEDILEAALSIAAGMRDGIDLYVEMIRAGPEDPESVAKKTQNHLKIKQG